MNLNIFKLNSIKARVTLFTLAIFLISIWSLAFYTSRMLQVDIQRMLGDQQFSTVSVLAADINHELDDYLRTLKNVAARITPAMLSSAASMQVFLENRPALQSNFNGGTFITRLDGTTIADVSPSTRRIGINYKDRDYMIAALRGETTISRPVISRALNIPVIVMATPVRDVQGNVIGVLAGVIDLNKSSFLGKISENRYGKSGGYVIIAPQHKLIVTATDKSLIMKPIPAPGINLLLDRVLQGFEGSGVTVDSLGLKVLSSTKQIPVAGWLLAARIPVAEAFAPIYDMQQRMLIATIFLTLLAGCLTWWIVKRQLFPMLSTIKTLAALSDSDKPPMPLSIDSQDEIGQLVGGFNHLLETLKQREEALKESEEKFRTLIQKSPDAHYIIDENSYFIDCNQAALNLLRISSKEELFTRMVADISPVRQPDGKLSREEAKVIIDEIRAKGSLRFEWVHQRANGESFPADVLATALTLNGKDILHTVICDITERKQAEKVLERNRMGLRQIIDLIPEMLWLKDVHGRFLMVNLANARNYNMSVEALTGKLHSEIHSDMDEVARMLQDDRRVIETGVPLFIPEESFLGADGITRYLQTTKIPFDFAETGEPAILGFALDITERKKMEVEFRQAKVVAEAANTAKSRFLDTMSHEIRTLMNVAIGVIQLLQHSELTPEQREYTEIAKNSGIKLVQLLNDILDLSKIEADKLELELSDFDLQTVISDAIALMSLQAREKALQLTSSIDNDVPTALTGDAGRLHQIIINLVNNAIKFTLSGSITLHIEKETEDDRSTTLRFLISDSGIGIATDKLEQIFAPFTQADSSTTRTYGGSGLGLSICKRLVELMGGSIGVESVEGEGTTFWFTVMMEKQIEGRPIRVEAGNTPSSCAGKGSFSANGIRILLTEDEPNVQKIFPRLLKPHGYLVDVAVDGKEALQALENNDYALVLMDCMMPGMNGYEVTAVIRDPASAVRRHDIPIIALTGNAMKQDRDECIAAGMDDHLPKPLLLPDLLAMLEKWLRK